MPYSFKAEVSTQEQSAYPINAILFDLDGTLVDSVPDLAVALNSVLTQLGEATVSEQQAAAWVGHGAARLVQSALQHCGRVYDPQHLLMFFAAYERCNGRYSRLFPGVREALQSLAALQLPMAIVTNKPMQFIEPLLSQLDILQYFRNIQGGDSVANKKPAPDMLLAACAALGTASEQALMVGDSRNDMEAAKQAGCRLACVSYGYNHGEQLADLPGYQPLWLGNDLQGLVAAISRG